MQIIAFMNMKGGVGKTTLSVNVAYALAKVHKKKVLIVDCDPQFSATQYLLDDEVYLARVTSNGATVRDIFVPNRSGSLNTVNGVAKRTNRTKMSLSDCTCPIFSGGNGSGRLDLIPSTLPLMEVDNSPRGTETKLKNYLREKATGYDYVIIDCPPTISIFTQAAILASDKYLVPIKPDPLSVIGLPLLERWLEGFTEDAGLQIVPVGLVFTLVRGVQRMREVMDEVRSTRGGEVFTSHLSESIDVSRSVEVHKPVFLYKKGKKTAGEVLAITEEFLGRTSGD